MVLLLFLKKETNMKNTNLVLKSYYNGKEISLGDEICYESSMKDPERYLYVCNIVVGSDGKTLNVYAINKKLDTIQHVSLSTVMFTGKNNKTIVKLAEELRK